MNRVLREEFVWIYSEPVLQNFLNQQRKDNPGIELPDPPAEVSWAKVTSLFLI